MHSKIDRLEDAMTAILEKLGCDRRTQAIAAFLQSLGVGQNHNHTLAA